MLRTFALALAMIASTWVMAASSDHEEALIERIKPVGKVCLAGDDCAVAPVAVAEPSGPLPGDQVYNQACMACHNTGVAGAPKLGDAAAWSAREAKGMETLMVNAINGIGGMPPRGTCASCSDEEIQGAIEYILAESK